MLSFSMKSFLRNMVERGWNIDAFDVKITTSNFGEYFMVELLPTNTEGRELIKFNSIENDRFEATHLVYEPSMTDLNANSQFISNEYVWDPDLGWLDMPPKFVKDVFKSLDYDNE